MSKVWMSEADELEIVDLYVTYRFSLKEIAAMPHILWSAASVLNALKRRGVRRRKGGGSRPKPPPMAEAFRAAELYQTHTMMEVAHMLGLKSECAVRYRLRLAGMPPRPRGTPGRPPRGGCGHES